ncbi:MAG: hypothetical protein EP329_01805 [Deltaproteobacteria bacterium]|nr:MAG: hypothetical protein EP329_01805 [Deltaproteobacteria bacterium]
MTRAVITASFLLSILWPGISARAGAPPTPREGPAMTVKLTAKNGMEVRLDGDTVHIRGPLPATREIADEQLAFGAATVGDEAWTTWSAAALTELRLGEPVSGRVDASVRRVNVAGARSAPIPLPAVDDAAARALLRRLEAARERLATVEEVALDALFADPTRYHGRIIRLDDVLADQRFESAEVSRGRGRGFWMDAELPEGSWRLTATGRFEAEAGRSYGHMGMWPGRWQVREILARRPAVGSLIEVAQRRVAEAAFRAFERVERPTFGWEPALTPAIPRPWPAAGRPGEVCFLLYGWGTSKAGDTHVGSVWGRACVAAEAPQAPVRVEVLTPTLEDLGDAHPFAPDGHEALALASVGMAVEGLADAVKVEELAPHYRAWLATRPQLGPALRAADAAFWKAIE